MSFLFLPRIVFLSTRGKLITIPISASVIGFLVPLPVIYIYTWQNFFLHWFQFTLFSSLKTLLSIQFLGSCLLLTSLTDHSITVNSIWHLHMSFAVHFHLLQFVNSFRYVYVLTFPLNFKFPKSWNKVFLFYFLFFFCFVFFNPQCFYYRILHKMGTDTVEFSQRFSEVI